jgi:hypothetical protein
MPRYSLRTLLILLAVVPPLGAWVWLYPEDFWAIFKTGPMADLLGGYFIGIVVVAIVLVLKQTVTWILSRRQSK